MTNGEKYKTAKERAVAFNRFCAFDNNGMCEQSCKLDKLNHTCGGCAFVWLDLEAEEEKPLPCIYCKGDMIYFRNANGSFLHCAYCNHQTRGFDNYETVVREYNRLAKAVKESEVKA